MVDTGSTSWSHGNVKLMECSNKKQLPHFSIDVFFMFNFVTNKNVLFFFLDVLFYFLSSTKMQLSIDVWLVFI